MTEGTKSAEGPVMFALVFFVHFQVCPQFVSPWISACSSSLLIGPHCFCPRPRLDQSLPGSSSTISAFITGSGRFSAISAILVFITLGLLVIIIIIIRVNYFQSKSWIFWYLSLGQLHSSTLSSLSDTFAWAHCCSTQQLYIWRECRVYCREVKFSES